MKRLISAGLGTLLCFVLLTSSISQAQMPGWAETSVYPDWAVVDPQPEFEFAPLRSDPQSPPPPGTGYVPPPMDLSHLTGQRMPGIGVHQTLPASYDWRDHNGVTSVKNQGNCGSCFAFAAVGNFEARMKVEGEGDFDFSENNAKECTYRPTSCGGGNFFDVVNLFTQKGTVLEACDPYKPNYDSCNTSCPYQKTVLDWRIISDGVADTAVLKQYIYDYGPVYTAMYAGSSAMAMADPNSVHAPTDAWGDELRNYRNVTYTLQYGGSEPPNHAVLIVGWDDERYDGKSAWIVKNSWGDSWGDSGFFYIAYESAQMGTASAFVYEWQDYDNDGSLWYYDEGGLGNAMGCGNTTAWGLVRFTPPNNTNVTRVDFWTIDTTTDVDIYIYDDFDGSTTSNLLASKLNNAFNEAGYHSVPLDTPLSVTSGDDVVVVVKFTNQSLTYPVVIDLLGPPENGRTYMSCSGNSGSWTDMGTDYNVDVAIRLRTGSLTPAPTVTSITPNTGENTGSVSVTITGSDFQTSGTTGVKLTRTGESDINGTDVTVNNDSQITCDFDLTGAAAGDWHVVVTNPDAQSGQLDNGFTITALPAPDVSISKSVAGSGGSGFEPGDAITFTLAIANEGDAPATNVTVTDDLPAEILNPSYDSTLTVTPTGAFSYTWAVEELGADASGVINIYGQIDPSLDSDFSFVNAASISDPDDVTPSNDSSSVSVVVGAVKVYLPLVMKRWPPIPNTPSLYTISNQDGDGNYTISWSTAERAETYILEEANNASFSNPSTAYSGAGLSTSITGKSAGIYYYRVKARNAWGDSGLSTTRSVQVGPTPGYWEAYATEFYVTTNRSYVDKFAIYVSVEGCGNYKITHNPLEPINNNNQFSFSGSFYASGTFNSITTASGATGLDDFPISGCGYVSGGPWQWSATWQNSSQPTFVSAEVMEMESQKAPTNNEFYTVTRIDHP